MPLSGPPLGAGQLSLLETWINQGGVYDEGIGSYGKPGYLGTGSSLSAYYSNGSGAGLSMIDLQKCIGIVLIQWNLAMHSQV